MEEWKSVNGWEDYYEVSNTGKVRSKERIIEDVLSKGGVRRRVFKSKELKGQPVCDKGHLSVGLYRNGRGHKPLVHRLVAEHFIPNPEDKPIIDHIDGDPTNNHVDNLRWATYHENNCNTPYARYLSGLLSKNNIDYKSEKEFYEATDKGT